MHIQEDGLYAHMFHERSECVLGAEKEGERRLENISAKGATLCDFNRLEHSPNIVSTLFIIPLLRQKLSTHHILSCIVIYRKFGLVDLGGWALI